MEPTRIDIPIGITLDRFIQNNEKLYPKSEGQFSQLIRDIALAAKVVNREINKAGLIDIMGYVNNENNSGEQQQRLDILANIRFSRALAKGGETAGIISEEIDSFVDFKNHGKYIVAIDPLDGSSNIDVNVSIGTIFSIFKRRSPLNTPLTQQDFLQKGKYQVASGYILYGTSTILMLAIGDGVNGFTFETTLGEFILSHPSIICNKNQTYYSINEGIANQFTQHGISQFISYCKNNKINGRYIGSLVADFHRNLLKGGVFLYPPTIKNKNGKLRLLFEANALAFIIEKAGGKASNGKMNILEIEPTDFHQQTPLYIGTTYLVNLIEEYLN
ncbi:MAG: class 1 fructose-bisphosphatase [Sediminibacterium sp.]|nr:class 1 fructose-bisphosphatase [Sediminibacterium sp.]